MKQSELQLDKLKKYISFLYQNHFEEVVNQYLKRSKDLGVPLLKFFRHLTEEELLQLARKGMEEYLVQIIEGKAVEAIYQSMDNWKKDKLPGIPKEKLIASDITLIYNSRKHILKNFLPHYTSNMQEALEIINEIEDFYTFQETLAMETFAEIQKEEIIKREVLLTEAQKMANLGNWEYDHMNKKVRWSDQMYAIFGIDQGIEPSSEIIKNLISQEDLAALSKAIEQSAETGQPFTHVYEIKRPDGEIRIISERGYVEKNGKEIIRGISQDITEHKKREDELRKSRDHYLTLLEDFPAMIWRAGLDTQCNYFNSTWLNFTGKSLSQETGNGWANGVHPDDSATCLDIYLTNFKKQSAFYMEYRLKRSDGVYRWIADYGRPFKDLNGNFGGFLGACYDITDEIEYKRKLRINNKELKQAEEELRSLNNELEVRVRERTNELLKNNKELIKINNDLDNFVYTASHDLKAPVANIEGLISTLPDILDEETKMKEDFQEVMKMVSTSIGKFKNTIKDLTDIAQIQKNFSEDITDINIVEVIEDVQLSIRDEIFLSNASIRVNVASCPSLRYSKKNFKSIIYNLLSNSIKYRSFERPAAITIKTSKFQDSVLLSIQDNGLGIESHKVGQIFSMFKRFHDHVEGTGVGLYIVKRIVENNNGKIEVESKVNKGTIFKIYFNEPC